MTGETDLGLPVKLVDVERLVVGPKWISSPVCGRARKPAAVVDADRRDAFRSGQFLERFALAPGKGGAVLEGGLLVALCFVEGFGMLFHQSHPFDLLLEEAESAP